MLYLSIGKPAQAESLLLQALAIWRTTFGEMHRDVAMALNNLAEIYRDMGKYA